MHFPYDKEEVNPGLCLTSLSKPLFINEDWMSCTGAPERESEITSLVWLLFRPVQYFWQDFHNAGRVVLFFVVFFYL